MEGRWLTEMHAQLNRVSLDWSYMKEQCYDMKWVCKLETGI